MIEQNLAGKTIAITGSTGFLGTALVERLLRGAPDCNLVLLVRAGKRTTAKQRVQREILRNDAFDRLRDELGKEQFDAMCERRIAVIEGDVSQDSLGLSSDDLQLFAKCDTVIHSAATVSFENPLDTAVEINLLGPVRVVQTIQQCGSKAHLVAVSTAYVAGARRGPAHEELLTNTEFAVGANWRVEVAAAQRLRTEIEDKSREPHRLKKFAASARKELGNPGTPTLAIRTEKLRDDWVRQQMVEYGIARAQSLGWPDAYAYTKAMGERALLDSCGDVGVSIVRPSIIESAWAEPKPGWIRGFRMAEPVIISYARGLLREFPGIPEGVIDVIPVDLVVAAICAVAAKGPDKDGPEVFQVASGGRNPLRYRRLVDLASDYFAENPVYDQDGQPIVTRRWTFPGRGRVQRQLQRTTRLLKTAESTLEVLPLRGRYADIGQRISEQRSQAERALGYVTIYGKYTETEAIYQIDRLIKLYQSLPSEDQQKFCMDPAVVDWDKFVTEIHLPSVVKQSRARTKPNIRATADGKTVEPPTPEELRRPVRRSDGAWSRERELRGRAAVLDPARQFAVFDLENTLIASNVVTSYATIVSHRMTKSERLLLGVRLLAEAPSLLALDARDRGDFLRSFYRRYQGIPLAEIRQDVAEVADDLLLRRCFPAGFRRVREHQALGHRTLLIAGALDFLVEPLAPLFDEIIASHMTVDNDGMLTGELESTPPTGEARALVVSQWSEANGLDCNEGVIYADSTSDLPMLDVGGYPVAVNADTKLARIAATRGWHTEYWGKASGTKPHLLPLSTQNKKGT